MANPAFAPGHFFKDRMKPRVLEKLEKEDEHARKLQAAYTAVNLREKNHCQVSGVLLYPTSSNDQRRREHHHLKGRNVKPEWVYEPKRILLCSAFIHALLQAKLIRVEGTDATKPLTFTWDRKRIARGKEPLRLERVS